MEQWPHNPHELAKVWTLVAHGTKVVEYCEQGLNPTTTKGFTTFSTKKGSTELTCSLEFHAGDIFIPAEKLVVISLCCLMMTMNKTTAVAFCSTKWHTDSFFWHHIKILLGPSFLLPSMIETACLIENPNCKSFALRCWNRLRSRLGLILTDKILTDIVEMQWSEGKWTAVFCRWMSKLQTPYVMTQTSKADLIVGGLGIAIPKRDKVFLCLLSLFSEPFNWGEKKPTECPFFEIIDKCNDLYHPSSCDEHRQILTAIESNKP